LKFHHFGLATQDEKSAQSFLSKLGYEIGKKIFDPCQSVDLTLCHHESHPDVELVSSSKEKGPLESILKNNHCLTYHHCFTCYSIAQVLEQLNRDQIHFISISPPKPAVLFNNRKVAFIFVQGFGLLELLHDS
jgi:methylmalonyl-CoA/ethylmalonyl-CoA epimerase